ncbi:hypothetical protein Tco_0963041 [Tanacetum coccineum]
MYGALIPEEMINQDIKDSKAYKTYLDFATGKATPKKAWKFKKVPSPSKKLSPVLEEEPTKKPKRAKKPTKKSTIMPTAGVVIRYNPGEFVLKKKAPTKVDSGKDVDLLSEAALLEAAQLKKTLKKSKLETHKLHASGSGTSTKSGVLDVPKYQSESKNESWGNSKDDDRNDDDNYDVSNDDDDVDSDADDDNEASNSEKTDSDEDENPNLNQNDDEEDEYEEEYVRTPDNYELSDDDKEYEELYKDVNVRLKDVENKEEGEGDAKMTDKTEGQMQSSSISSDFANQFLNLDNAPPVNNEVISMMNVKLDKDLFESYGKAYSLKRDRKDKDKDEDPSAGSDQGLKRRKTRKDIEPSKGYKSKESKSSLSKGTKSHPKSSSKSAQAEESVLETANTEMPQNQGSDLGNTDDQPNVEAALKRDYRIAQVEKPPLTFDELMSTPIDFSAYVMNHLKIDKLTQEHLVGPTFNLLKGTCKSRVELEYNFEECYKALTDQLDWTNPEGKEYPFDLSKPLPLIKDQGHQVVPVNYFINNNLEYLKCGSSNRKYTTSITKTKAAKYDIIQGIEDMVPSLWSLVKHDVYSTKRIIAVTHVKVMKWYDYGYLEEIEVRREDQKLYKFKEGDFLRLNLRDIEDMLLLLVQNKILNIERNVIFDLNVALWMFTRRVVILKRVEDLQLGVKSYQKKLNITKPQTFKSYISNRTPYTAYNNPQGIIYVDKYKRNRLMHSDKLYKFSDGTLISFRFVLHDIASNLRLDYFPKRRWSNLDKQRSCIMIKAIDKLQIERRLMRNLEKFVGGRDYEEDFRLLERTI